MEAVRTQTQSRGGLVSSIVAALHAWRQRRREAAAIIALAEAPWTMVTPPDDHQVVTFKGDGFVLTFCAEPIWTDGDGYFYSLTTQEGSWYYEVDAIGRGHGPRVVERLFMALDVRYRRTAAN